VPPIPAASDALRLSPDALIAPGVLQAVAAEAHSGLTSTPKTLAPWLFYDHNGSRLFERITQLPEYYLTRVERGIFRAYAGEIIAEAARPTGTDPVPVLTLIELGAGTATKTGILLAAAVRQQGSVVYQPVDVSRSALAKATDNILKHIPGVTVRCQVADYTREPLPLNRLRNTRTLALYIGSSIGNFAPAAATAVLSNLRAQLLPGDMLLLGTDLAPHPQGSPSKTVAGLLSAYNDAAGVTAAFNLNVLARLNRELDANFDLSAFHHCARWNSSESRIEMHLESLRDQTARIPAGLVSSNGRPYPALNLHFRAGETIHTENSYKFTAHSIAAMLASAIFSPTHTWHDADHLFAVTLATAI
jgi:L-histidine Nalpha-methyltransferase